MKKTSLNKFGVVGYPIAHSMSPIMFRKAFAESGIDAIYTCFSIEDIGDFIRISKELSLDGFNVTAPFKQSIIPYLDEIDPSARMIDAVNVVVVRDGHLIGYNTDFIGVIGALEVNGVVPENKSVLVIGAGGAARAAVFGLKRLGMDVSLVNRSWDNAIDVGMELQVKIATLDGIESAVCDSDIIVSCLPGDVDMIDASWLHKDHIVMDANYVFSSMLRKARNKNCKIIDGRDWLWAQALPSFELFVGKQAPVDIMKKAVLEERPERKNIALIGFMGAGKSAVAQELSEKMDWIDVDEEIEKKIQKTISEIFDEDGEEVFRKIEKDIIAEVCNRKNTIISCGGGVILDNENIDVLRKNCHIVWLFVGEKTAFSRIGDDKMRPLLGKDIYAQRLPLYLKSADVVIDTENRDPTQISKHIIEELKL